MKDLHRQQIFKHLGWMMSIKCKCCDKEYIVTWLDFVNQEVDYVEDDERC